MDKVKKNKIFMTLFIVTLMFFLVAFVVGVIFTTKAKKEVETIEKNEMTNITYKVTLNNGEVYTQDNNYDFAPTLVDNIKVDFEYFNDTNPQNYLLTAYIVTYVKSVSKDGNTTFAVIDSVETVQDKLEVINESTYVNFEIDYQTYVNKLSTYITNEGLSSESGGKLELVLVADKKNSNISNKAQVSITILEDSVDVEVNKSIYNVSSTLLGNNSNTLLIATVFCALIDLILIVAFYCFYKVSRMDDYKRTIYKIFMLYKSVLVKCDLTNFVREDLIGVVSFKELIKVHNSVSLPIIYSENEKGYEFIIKVGNGGYYYKLVK